MQIDNAAIARQLGYSREEMIAKFGQPGAKTPTEIGNTLGLKNSEVNTIFGTPQNTSSSSSLSSLSLGDIIEDSVKDKDHAAIAKQLGYTKEEMIEKFGNPGDKTPSEIGSLLGLSDSEVTNIFGTPKTSDSSTDTTTTSSDDNDEVDSFTRTKDDKYKEVADALGYDELSVSAVMKAIENGVSGTPDEIVPKLAYDLGLPQTFVSNVLSYLNNGQI